MRHTARIAIVAPIVLAVAPVQAGNTLIAAGQRVAVAGSALTVQPDAEWNRLGARPGRDAERWTLDGDRLNALTFYGGIDDDRTLFREVDRKNYPLPRFAAAYCAAILEHPWMQDWIAAAQEEDWVIERFEQPVPAA